MLHNSPNFKDAPQRSGSPVPLRSPSPDFMTKSAIVNTPQSAFEYKHKLTDRLSLAEEVKYLRDENRKLLQIASAKGNAGDNSLSEVLKDKDRVIENLKSQLKAAEGKGGKAGLNLLTGSAHKHSPSEGVGLDLKHENEELRVKIRKLFQENEDLKRKKSGGEAHFPKPQGGIDVSQGSHGSQFQLTKSNIDRVKEQLGKELLSSIDGMMNNFSLKLKDIEHRVSLIESKLSEGTRVPSGSKGPVSTIGNQSPSPFSNFGTGSKNNRYENNFSTPPPGEKRDNLSLRVEDLENQLGKSKNSEHQLNNKLYEFQSKLNDRDIEIENLENDIRKLKSDLRAAQAVAMTPSILTDSQGKNKVLEENYSLRQTLTGQSAELSTLKNEKLGLERQNQLLRKELELERKNKTSPMGASQTDQHIIQSLNMKIENYQNNSKQLVNETISLRDTLTELRKTNNQIVNELDEFKRQNYSLKSRLEGIEKDKSDLEIRARADSNAEIASQTENMKLRLRINELQEQAKDQDFYANQIRGLKEELNTAQLQVRELKTKQFDLDSDNNNLRKEAQRAYGLAEENEMLKRSINNYERTNEDLLKGSDHTKNELVRVNHQKLSLQNEIIQVKSNLRLNEGDLVAVRERLSNLEKEYRKLEQQNNMNIVKINQSESSLNNAIIERDNLANQNQQLSVKLRTLEFEYLKLKNDNQKEDLLNEVNVLTTRLRESEHHLSNSKRVEEQRNAEIAQKNNELHQKNSELLQALSELAEARRLLQEVNFESVEAIVKELQNKEKVAHEQRVEHNRLSQQSSQQLSKLAFDNDKLKKELLELNQRLYEQKERADRFSANINQLEAEKVALNERIGRLDEAIRQYISQDNARDILSRTEVRQSMESSYYDERSIQRQLTEVQHLKEPFGRAVEKLDRAAQKISRVVEENSRGSIMQTQSYLIQSNISSGGDSRKK